VVARTAQKLAEQLQQIGVIVYDENGLPDVGLCFNRHSRKHSNDVARNIARRLFNRRRAAG
jgi:hypothetical protein